MAEQWLYRVYLFHLTPVAAAADAASIARLLHQGGRVQYVWEGSLLCEHLWMLTLAVTHEQAEAQMLG
jgi:hypothetical protein